MNKCRRCGELKDLSLFYKSKPNFCIECIKKQHNNNYIRDRDKILVNKKVYYMNNKEKFKLYNKEIYAAKRKNYRNELRDFVNELKSNKPCLECNKIFPAICMDYDHRDSSQKIKSVSRLIQLKYSKENILIEISKCDLVCVNCHRARTQQKYGIRTKITSKEKKIRASKNKPCSDCNQIYPWFIMEFDHRDRAQKKGPVSQTKLENLAEEIGKCDIVCVVCHRLRSSKQMSWGQQNNDQHLIFDAK